LQQLFPEKIARSRPTKSGAISRRSGKARRILLWISWWELLRRWCKIERGYRNHLPPLERAASRAGPEPAARLRNEERPFPLRTKNWQQNPKTPLDRKSPIQVCELDRTSGCGSPQGQTRHCPVVIPSGGATGALITAFPFAECHSMKPLRFEYIAYGPEPTKIGPYRYQFRKLRSSFLVARRFRRTAARVYPCCALCRQ
jgi:hypothetical protein